MSETENIRKNLAIERMIIEGCEILLDTSQTFVRQGTSPVPCPPPPQAAPGTPPNGMSAECLGAAGGLWTSYPHLQTQTPLASGFLFPRG